MLKGELEKRIDTIEESYEFMLAYAAQGLPGDDASPKGAQLREYLNRVDQALIELTDLLRARVQGNKLEPAERYDAFLQVLERDAKSSQATIELVLAQPSISSELVDNLNASIHLRALLTDLFLIDEALKVAKKSSEPTSGPDEQ